nr:ACT domain-containing protein [Sphingosinicella terrae]
MLAGLEPRLDPVEYGFETAAEPPPVGKVFALIREEEGLTVIRPGIGWARITLGVNSSLEAVGLTARVAAALAERGIAANLVAGYHHDHLFVPWEDRQEALAVLRRLHSASRAVSPDPASSAQRRG